VAEQLPKGVRRRGGVLWVSVSRGGRRLRRAGGRTLEEALQVRAELLTELGLAGTSLSTSTEPQAPLPADPTVAELADRYLQNLRVTAKPSAVATAESALRHVKRQLGEREGSSLTGADLTAYQSRSARACRARGCEQGNALPARDAASRGRA